MSDYSGRLFKPNNAQRKLIETRKAVAAENAAIENRITNQGFQLPSISVIWMHLRHLELADYL